MSAARPRSSATAAFALLLPALLVLVFALHLRSLPQLLDFRLHYQPAPPDAVVRGLVAHGPRRALLHDPHVIAYLALPLFLVTAIALHRRGSARHPRASACACAITAIGTIYLGGVFGMWTAFYDGLAHVDPRDIDGATAAFAAMTAPRGAFLLTTSLAKLAFAGLALQGLVLWGPALRDRLAASCLAVGSALFLAFWDLDNWMLVGSVLLVVGLAAGLRAERRQDDADCA